MINLLTFSYEIFLRRREDIPNIEKIGNLNMNSLGRIYDTWLVPLMGESNVLIQFVKFLFRNKITVRHLASYHLPKHVRMTIGNLNEMKKTIKVCNSFNV